MNDMVTAALRTRWLMMSVEIDYNTPHVTSDQEKPSDYL